MQETADDRHVGLRRLETHTVLDATDRIHAVSTALRGVAADRVIEDRPETRRLRASIADGRWNQSKPVRHDADDRLRPAVDDDGTADQRRIGSNRPLQNPSLRTMALGDSASDGRNVRPAIGVTPSNSKKRAVTDCDVTCSAVPSGTIIVAKFARNAAIATNDWFCSAQSL